MNHLILTKTYTIFYGANPRSLTEHQHPVIQLAQGIDQPFLSKSKKGEWIPQKAMLIPPNLQHECDASHIPVFTMTIDPETSLGEWIQECYFATNEVLEATTPNFPLFDTDKCYDFIQTNQWSALHRLIESTFRYDPEKKSLNETDQRIRTVIQYIKTNIQQPITTQHLMQVAHLSESRLLHLFKEQMGLPIRNYILWYRLQLALKSILAENNLTRAAYEAGFSDQAHLSRVCSKMLGIPPSTITKNSKFVQVSLPD